MNATDDLSRRTLRGLPFRLVRAALLAVLVPLLHLKIEGLENVPPSGPIIVIGNHLHNADPVLLSVAFPRPLHFMAKKEAFSVPLIGSIIRRVGAFPVNRGNADRGAIRRAEATLSQGIALGIFPEGTRSVTRSLQPAHPGAALIALRSGAPVLPCGITGSERLPFNGSKGGRRQSPVAPSTATDGVRIRFGVPFVVPREPDGGRLSTEEATQLMMAEVARLLPVHYRGHYTEAALPAPERKQSSARCSPHTDLDPA